MLKYLWFVVNEIEKVKQLFFFIDLDGTLIDSRFRVYKLFIDLSDSSISFDDYWKIKQTGKTNHDVLNQLQISKNEVLHAFKEDWFKLIETKQYLSFDELITKSTVALEKLNQLGMLVLVTSRQSKENTLWQLHELGISGFFHDVIVTEHKKTKPLALADWLKASNHEVADTSFMIGDTEEDLKAGMENKVKTVGVLTGFRSEAFLRSLPFHECYDSVYQFSNNFSSTPL